MLKMESKCVLLNVTLHTITLKFISSVFSSPSQLLKQISQKYRTDKVFPTSAGETDTNIRKNRYRDILPCKSPEEEEEKTKLH